MNNSSLGPSRILVLLEEMATKESNGITELSRKLVWSKGLVHKLVHSLIDMGYAEKVQGTDRYRLTLKIFEIGNQILSTGGLVEIAMPSMLILHGSIDETINLAVLVGSRITYISKIESNHTLSVNIRVGSSFPAHCTALGKTLLAYLDPVELDQFFHNTILEKMTQSTIADELSLRKEFSLITKRGVGFDLEELMSDVICLAVPIMDQTMKVIAGLSISGPKSRMDNNRLKVLSNKLIQTAQEISSKLGYLPKKENHVGNRIERSNSI